MNLEYRILWIDDQPSHVSPARDFISVRLARKGFSLAVTAMTSVGTTANLRKAMTRRPGFDLVLVDFKLGEGNDTGDKVASKVRSAAPGTDIVFYSAADVKDLLDKIARLQIDGVFCAHRQNLGQKAWDVIEPTIRKALDLNGVRGIVMNAVADFDFEIDQAIVSIASRLDEEGRDRLREKILDRYCSFHAGKLDSLSKHEAEKEVEVLVALLTSDQKQTLLRKLLSDYDDHDVVRRLDLLDKYHDQVIKPRNDLAHGRSEVSDDGFVILNRKECVTFTEERFVGILHCLADHDDNLKRLNEILRSNGATQPEHDDG
jgi:DNA-binding NarL/FixJ family response regulator